MMSTDGSAMCGEAKDQFHSCKGLAPRAANCALALLTDGQPVDAARRDRAVAPVRCVA